MASALAVALGVSLGATRASASPPSSAGNAAVAVARWRSVPVINSTTVAQLTDPGVELTPPADGRLRGAGVALVVTGAALTNVAGTGDSEVAAGPGQDLLVFGLSSVPQPTSSSTSTTSSPLYSLAVVSAGQRRTIDAAALAGNGPWYFAVSVAKPVSAATSVNLELSADGYNQTFSLVTLGRVGPQPEILYRDPANPDVVDTDAATVPVTVNTGPPDSSTYQVQLGAATTTIGWFPLDASARTPQALDQAILDVKFQTATVVDPSEGVVLGEFTGALPADHIHLVLADGTTVNAGHVDASNLVGRYFGLFTGDYYFTVPADTAAATVRVDPYTETPSAGGAAASLSVAAFGLPLQLPSAPAAASAVPTTPTTLRFVDRPEPTSGGLGTTGSSSSDTVGGGVIVVLLAFGAVVWAVRRSRRRPAIQSQPSFGLQRGWMTVPPPPPATPPARATPPTATPSGEPTVARGLAAADLPEGADAAEKPDGAEKADHREGADRSPPPPSPSQPTRSVGTRPPVTEPPMLTPIPSQPWSPPDGVLYFEILGPLRVTGCPDGPVRSTPVLDLACFLALHPGRSYTAEELRDPLSVGKVRALEADTIRTYAGNLRRAVGANHLPDAGRAGYRLADADTDWHHFQQLAAAPAVSNGDAAARARALAEALALVRGAPFADLPTTGFGWVATELLVSQAEAAVIAAARQLTILALGAGDWPLTAWAAERGLAVSPTEHALNAAALRAAEASGQPDRLAQTWRDVTRRFAAVDEAEPVPGDLDRLHRQLRTPTTGADDRSAQDGGARRARPGATR